MLELLLVFLKNLISWMHYYSTVSIILFIVQVEIFVTLIALWNVVVVYLNYIL